MKMQHNCFNIILYNFVKYDISWNTAEELLFGVTSIV